MDLSPLALLERAKLTADALRAMGETGLLRPRVAVTAAQAVRSWGPTLASGYVASARRSPDAIGIVDDEGSLTFAEIDDLSNRLASVLASRSVGPGTPVGLLARNSRWFAICTAALNKLGASVLYMNTGFAGPQLADVMKREGGELLLHDDEFSAAAAKHAPDLARIITDRTDGGGDADVITALIDGVEAGPPDPPATQGRQVILTSGTTGVPKGASRSNEGITDLVATSALFQRVPYRVGDVHVIPSPAFHSLGNAALLLSAQLSQTAVLSRRFDPRHTLALVAEHQAQAMTAVPVMLQRMVDLPEEDIDTSSLRSVLCSGAALPGSLATRWMDRFGDNLYNMYGSTEVAAATIATPEDMRAAPGTAGKPLAGVAVRLYDDDDREVKAPGVDGRIFVGSALRFDGYTGGQTKPSIDGLLSSGDVGRWDDDGRLYVGGRDDDMIVSGGENLYPREVEDLLADLDGINDVAVVGVDDEEFGKRLAAFVVLESGAALTADDVKAHVKANLANFKVPRSVTFIDQLPRNATGKVLRRDLREK
ncbi:AMP-binding protein [Actinospongicola halichondriae]|uniref:AMP-binding protein n=1 Tax=Actinospongicola halichondriae TaxID=3236844 RepID=UPI003D42F4A7